MRLLIIRNVLSRALILAIIFTSTAAVCFVLTTGAGAPQFVDLCNVLSRALILALVFTSTAVVYFGLTAIVGASEKAFFVYLHIINEEGYAWKPFGEHIGRHVASLSQFLFATGPLFSISYSSARSIQKEDDEDEKDVFGEYSVVKELNSTRCAHTWVHSADLYPKPRVQLPRVSSHFCLFL